MILIGKDPGSKSGMTYRESKSGFFRRSGFTLFELLITLAVIGIALAFIVPRVTRRKASSEWPQVIAHFNDLMSLAQQMALRTGKTCRLVFVKKTGGGGEVTVQTQKILEKDDGKNRAGTIVYQDADDPIISEKYEIPADIMLVKIYTPNLRGTGDKNVFYNFVISGGMAQETVIHLERTQDERVDRVSFVMNPFLGTFKMHSGFAPFPKKKRKVGDVKNR